MRPQHDGFVPTASVRYPITFLPSRVPFGDDRNGCESVEGRWSVRRALLLALLVSSLLWSLFAATLYAALN